MTHHTEKPCSKCELVKPLDEFKRQATGKYGRTAACKDCERAQRRARYAVDPERERTRLRDRYAANPELYREAARKWRRTNPDQAKSTSRQNVARRKAERLAADLGDVDERAARMTPGPCYLCGQALPDDRLDGRKVHLDHVIPLSRDGAHGMANLRPTHPGCNLRKHDRLLSELTWYTGPTSIGRKAP